MTKSAKVSDLDDLDFEKLLEDELESVVLPEVHDQASASTDVLVKDIHKLLAGNGGPQRGLVFKVAATRASVQIMRNEVGKTQDAVAAQDVKLTTLQSKFSEGEADKRVTRRIVKFLWSNKNILLILVLILMSYLNGITFTDNPSLHAKIDKMVEKRIEKLLESFTKDGETPPADPVSTPVTP